MHLTKLIGSLREHEDRVILFTTIFRNIDDILDDLGIEKVDGILLDLEYLPIN